MDWHDYFQHYESYFWQWEEEGGVLAVPRGSTIAYSAYVTELLEHLSGQGFPPFGSLLLCLIATNPDGENALNTVYALMDTSLGIDNGTKEPLKSAILFLKLLAQLPKKYKEGKNRLLLFQTLFANCHKGVSAKRARTFLDNFLVHQQKQEKPWPIKDFNLNAYINDFRTVSLLAGKFPDADTILKKMADLPLVEEAILLKQPAPTQPGKKDFIQELIDHTQTFHIGSLIKSLWGSLQIPHHYHLPSQQPMGGIADLTNRGGFDRLLLSEFAHEELVFLSRLANNEALYVNREMPPQHNQLERVILIDVSIKSWGTPKTLAYALLLAIARHPKTDIPCSAFAVGKECRPLAFGSVDEVIASLQVLEPCLHPAEGLEAFFKMGDSLADKEVIFVAAKEVFEQPPLRKIVSDYQQALNYLIQTDNTGNIDVYRKQQNGRKHMQHIRLDLEAQWRKEPVKSLVQVERAKETKQVYPILFPATSNPKNILPLDGALFVITAEGSLIRAVDHQSIHAKGWEMFYENLPLAKGEAELGLMENGEYVLLQFNEADKKVFITNLKTGKEKTAYFQEWKNSSRKKFIFYKDVFIYSFREDGGNYWVFEFDEDIVIRRYGTTPRKIADNFMFREDKLKMIQYKNWGKSVLKSIHYIFVNEVNNLVFDNLHELRLTDHSIIKFEKTGFTERVQVATPVGKDAFRFPDGTVITVNRSGMLILRSSNPSIDVIYIPSVLDADLGVASESDIAGNHYYYPEGETKKSPISRAQFWKRYMEPFIDTIIKYGT